MKRFAILVVVVLALAAPAFATCPTAPGSLQCLGGSQCWYEYTPDDACVSTFGNGYSADSMCFSRTSVRMTGTGVAEASYSFTVTSDLGNWQAETSLDFSDPNSSSSNAVELWAEVNSTWTFLNRWDGTDGPASCETLAGYFDATVNDDVTIHIYLDKLNSNATVEASYPRIYTTNY